jgi:uncharacterized membrane protein YkoI
MGEAHFKDARRAAWGGRRIRKRTMLKRKIILASTAAAIALGAGGGVFAASQSSKNDDEAREIEAVRTSPVSLLQAIATAEQQSNGRAVSAEAEEGGGAVLYEIKTIGGEEMVEFQIDPQTGNVVKTEDEKVEGDDAEEYAGAAQLETTLAAAIASAEQATGGKAIEAGLDDEDGKALYEVELAAAAGTTQKAYIDAATGNVVKTAAGEDNDEEHE